MVHPLRMRAEYQDRLTWAFPIIKYLHAMAVPSYEELLRRWKVDNSIMELTFDGDHLREFSLILDRWEKLAKFLRIPNAEIEIIKSQGSIEEQRIKLLECWKQRCGSAATYKVLMQTLLNINRTD